MQETSQSTAILEERVNIAHELIANVNTELPARSPGPSSISRVYGEGWLGELVKWKSERQTTRDVTQIAGEPPVLPIEGETQLKLRADAKAWEQKSMSWPDIWLEVNRGNMSLEELMTISTPKYSLS